MEGENKREKEKEELLSPALLESHFSYKRQIILSFSFLFGNYSLVKFTNPLKITSFLKVTI